MKALSLATLVFSTATSIALVTACGTSDDTGGAVAPDVTTFCTDVATVVNSASCTELSAACKADVPSACPSSVAPGYGEAYMAALHSCAASETSCNLDPGEDACLFGKVTAATATAAQAKLATDFCTACVPGSTVQTGAPDGLQCSGDAITVPQGFGRVMGVNVLALSDRAAATADSCIGPAATAFPNDYDDCENSFLNCIVDQRGQAEGPAFFATCSAVDAGSASDAGR